MPASQLAPPGGRSDDGGMFGFLRKRRRQADAAKLRRHAEQREAAPGGGPDAEIGEELNARGGKPLMQAVCYEVFNWHPVNARGLQHTWDGVRSWMA